MAIRSTKNESYFISGDLSTVKAKVESALVAGGFKSIKKNDVISQVTADYRTFFIWGSIVVTLKDMGDKVEVNASATANVDNIWALLSSSTNKILNKFKNNIH